MKQTVTLLIVMLLLSGCTTNTVSLDTNFKPKQNVQQPSKSPEPVQQKSEESKKLESLLKKQFDSSSKVSIDSVLINGNKIAINLTGNDELGPVAIDVALVLNRNSDFSFESVEVKNSSSKATFNKNLFNSYRTGKINDVQFMNSL